MGKNNVGNYILNILIFLDTGLIIVHMLNSLHLKFRAVKFQNTTYNIKILINANRPILRT